MPIYDQTFRRYTGPRSTAALWWIVARNTMRPVLKNKLSWALLLMLVIAVVVMSVGFFASAKLTEAVPHRADAALETMQAQNVPIFGRNVNLATVLHRFILPMFSLVALLMLVTGSGSISRDLRHAALPLYFSRPLKPWHYVWGKILGLTIMPSVAMAVALLLLYVQYIAYFGSGLDLLRELPVLLFAILQVVITSLFLSTAITAFSSMTKTAGTAAVLFTGFLMLTFALAEVFEDSARNEGIRRQESRSFEALAPRVGLSVISRALLNPILRRWEEIDMSLGLMLAISSLLAYTCLFLILLRRNLRVVEVVK